MKKNYEVSFPFRSGSALTTLKEYAVDKVNVREVSATLAGCRPIRV